LRVALGGERSKNRQNAWLACVGEEEKGDRWKVNAKEQKLYRLELKLIKQYFKGLRPRPVKLVKKLALGAHGEAGEPHLLIRDSKQTRKELDALLKHELIHYELKDKGKVYHGHGEAFLKRAQELGIVNSYVLQRCFSAEEYEHAPTVRRTRKVPLPRFKRQVDKWFQVLFEQVTKLPDQQKIRLYPYVQNVYVGWEAFSAAVKAKKDHVFHEIWKIKRGPRRKGLHELQKEYALLQAQGEALVNKIKKSPKGVRDQNMRQELNSINLAMEKIRKTLEKDYGIFLRGPSGPASRLTLTSQTMLAGSPTRDRRSNRRHDL
jgi:hypothetical protein